MVRQGAEIYRTYQVNPGYGKAPKSQPLPRPPLPQYVQNKLDYSDALIGLINKSSGCHETVTLDQDAVRADNFKLVRI